MRLRPNIRIGLIFALVAVPLGATGAGCALYDDVSEPPDGSEAVITPDEDTVGIGNVTQLKVVTGGGQDIDPSQVDWSSSDESIATVDDTGLVTGISEGSTVVEASWLEADNLKAQITVKLQAMSIQPDSATIDLTKTEQFTAVTGAAEGEDIELEGVEWSSKDTKIAAFVEGKDGVLEAKSKGTTTITAKKSGVSASAAVDVAEPVVKTEILPGEVAPALGESVCLQGNPLNAKDKVIDGVDVSWNSKDASIAEITDTSGQNEGVGKTATVTAKGAGSTEVTAKAEGVSDTAKVTGSPWVQVATGYRFSCGLTKVGTAYCWGWNKYGQLGDDSTESRERPVRVAVEKAGAKEDPPPKFAELSAGRSHICGRTDAGSVYCWGNNGAFQLARGNNLVSESKVPLEVSFDEEIVDLAAGGRFNCVVTKNGNVQCWGSNTCGQLGHGNASGCDPNNRTLGSPSAEEIGAPDSISFASVAAGFRHTCGLTESGKIYCWGWLSHGQLGTDEMNGVMPDDDGKDLFNKKPREVESSKTTPMSSTSPSLPFQAVAAGQRHTCAIDNVGEVFCWGENTESQAGANCQFKGQDMAGDPKTYDKCAVPSEVPFSGSAAALSDAATHTCLLDDNDALHCWGWGYTGGLAQGRGNNDNHGVPQKVDFMSGFKQVSAAGVRNYSGGNPNSGVAHTCAIDGDDRVRCWGANLDGAIGNGNSGASAVSWTPTGLAFESSCNGGSSSN